MSVVASPETIVLVHGWAGSAESWAPVVARLEAAMPSTQVIAARLPGSPGGSSTAPSTIPAAARALTDLLEGDTGPALLVGHSMGAQVTLLAAVQSPHLVLGEVVIDPAYGAADGEREHMERWASDIDRIGHPAVDEFFRSAIGTRTPDASASLILQDLYSTPPPVIASYLRSEYVDEGSIGLESSTRSAASHRSRPVLAIHSSAAGAALESSLASPEGSMVVRWEGHGHYLHLEDPDGFVSALSVWRAERATLNRTPS